MPTIHLYGEIDGKFSEGNFAAFSALCARIGATEVVAPENDYFGHFYALGHGILIDFSAGHEAVEQVRDRLAGAGIKILPYSGRITLGQDWELEMIDNHVKGVARATAGQHLLACPSCHRAVGNGKFCPYCGAQCDSHLRWCPKCEIGYPPSFVHCTRCGGPLEPTGEWVFDYTDPEEVFDGVYLSDEDAHRPVDDDDYL